MITIAHPATSGQEPDAASAWVRRWAGEIAPAGEVLDLACGSGRNTRWLAAQGHTVFAVDRDAAALEPLRALPGVQTECLDLEGEDWPLAGRRFDAVVVCRYLYRPRFEQVLGAVTPGGLLIYETFMAGNEACGRPSRRDFLLEPGELASRAGAAGFAILGFREGPEFDGDGRPVAVTQSLCARRPPPA